MLPSLSMRKLGDAAREQLRRVSEPILRELVGPEFDDRLAEVGARLEDGADAFGLDLEWARWALLVAAFFHGRYFRAEVRGAERVPAGRVLLISNHSGQVPLDALVLGASMFIDARPPRILRSMVDKWTQTLPFIAPLFSRMGQIVGVPENARRLLEMGEAVLVFPEGSRGISKPYAKRYRLQPFGLGFMRLAQETRTPIVPVAVVGAEEQYVSLANVTSLAKLLRMPAFPIVPQLLIPGLQLPLPVKYRITYGEPMTFEGDADDDDAVVEERVRVVKQAIQMMLDQSLQERTSLFF